MTAPKITAPAQTELIQELCAKIEQSSFQMVSDSERTHRTRITEGEWDHRLTEFLNDPLNGIPNRGLARDLTRALLTKGHIDYLARATIDKHVKILKDPVKTPKLGGDRKTKRPLKDKAATIEKLRKATTKIIRR